MKKIFPSPAVAFVAAVLMLASPGCKRSEQSASPSQPKTSFGKAVKRARDLNRTNDEHTKNIDEQLDE